MSNHVNLNSLQILRFLASTSVVYFHLFVSPNFGEFGVDIFFVLSGFVISLVSNTQVRALDFAIARSSRIIPAYWLVTTVIAIAVTFFPHLFDPATRHSTTFETYVKSLFFIPYFGARDYKPILLVGWSLNYEMLFYLYFTIALTFWKSRTKLVVGILLAIGYLVGCELPRTTAGWFFGSEVVFEFILGLFAYEIFKANLLSKIPATLLLAVGVVSYCMMAYAEVAGLHLPRLIEFGVPSMLLVMGAVGLERFIDARNWLLSHLILMGDASYATYLTHWFIVYAIAKFETKVLSSFHLWQVSLAFLTVGLALVVGQVFFFAIDRPMSRRLKRVLYSFAPLRN
jgi:exopolysaccharide production protein ExoZ